MVGLSSLQALTSLSKLECLEFYECKNVTDLEPLNQLTSLRYLHILECGIEDLSSLSLSSLQSLKCEAPSFEGLSQLTSLTSLSFWADEWADVDLSEEDWEEFQHLPKLVRLESNVRSLDGLRYLRVGSLTELEISGAKGALRHAHVQGIPSLQKLTLDTCDDMVDLSPLSTLKNLEELVVQYHSSLKQEHLSSLISLSCLTDLKRISFIKCEPMKDPSLALSVLQDRGVVITHREHEL
jgi:internalin A